MAGLRFVNADVLARALKINPYEAATVADSLRRELVRQRESFVFETVFSDPVGDKLGFLQDAAAAGYTVVLCFIGISGAEVSEQRVAMRVTQGGHDVPTDRPAAQNWYRAAAERGQPYAQMMLGRFLLRAVAGEYNAAEARFWLERAAAQGLQEAKADLAALPPAPSEAVAEEV